ncbi:MAG: M15 family metallopeptidase, partial [Eubacteriales bacterium]|nr:M15 family metallopeptidase [Eubacteriales bacterium]
ILDIRYYTTFNFTGERVDGYEEPVALLTKEAAEALREANRKAMAMGYRLKIFDCYRPQTAVNHFIRWAESHRDIAMKNYFYPEVDKTKLFDLGFVAAKSGHSRGSTVDLTLFDMASQKDIDVGGTFDYFGKLSWAENSDGITQTQVKNRKLLRDLMMSCGFKPLAEEWWHFTLENEPYPDTYFTFPVNSNQVLKRIDLSEKLEKDMEFRLRFYDIVNESTTRCKKIVSAAVSQAFLTANEELHSFAEKENVRLNEADIEKTITQLTEAINNAVSDILKL